MTSGHVVVVEHVYVFAAPFTVTLSLLVIGGLLALFMIGGLVERFGYLCRRLLLRSKAQSQGQLPTHDVLPCVCVQLPMFNEGAVAARAIEAACRLDWPRDRLEVQVLDDSTDAGVRAVVDAAVAHWEASGIDCYVLRRSIREGYKAGALECGRRRTRAKFLAIFDADFVPEATFLHHVMPGFYDPEGVLLSDLAMVQGRWTHLNAADNPLTWAQTLWIDDHHVSQMGWRSEAWQFVNFTGTAGVWRAEAIEDAGGWSARTLVEDCELSLRTLFAGYRTQFVSVPVPAELPASVVAYKAQQRRWTLGWAQLLRLHLGTLLWRYECPPAKRLHLLYHATLSVSPARPPSPSLLATRTLPASSLLGLSHSLCRHPAVAATVAPLVGMVPAPAAGCHSRLFSTLKQPRA